MIKSMNHTQLPNEIIDVYMRDMSHIAFKVAVIICRKTFGWHKETDSISLSQIINLSGICKNSVIKAVRELEESNIIIVDRTSDGKTCNRYTINYESSSDNALHTCEPVQEMNMGGACREQGGGACREHTKDTLLNKDKERTLVKRSDLFDFFWKKYDRPMGKQNTIKQWNKLSEEDRKQVLDSLDNYIKARPDKQFRSYPERYIGNKIYLDFQGTSLVTNAFKELPVAK